MAAPEPRGDVCGGRKIGGPWGCYVFYDARSRGGWVQRGRVYVHTYIVGSFVRCSGMWWSVRHNGGRSDVRGYFHTTNLYEEKRQVSGQCIRNEHR